jgi:hypothetical protein
MQTVRDIAPYAALAAAALAIVLLVLVLLLWSSVRRLRRSQLVVMGHHEQRDIVEHVEHLDSQVRNLREAVEILTDQLDGQKRHLDHALTHRAIVRYDAFRDAGGEQSASFALLDEYRSGVVFSAIAARDFARIYVKHLDKGVADRDLSPEEQEVVAKAVPRPLAAGEEGPRAARAPALPDAGPPPFPAEAAPKPATPGDDEARQAFDALAQLESEARPDDDEPFTWDDRPSGSSSSGGPAGPDGPSGPAGPASPSGA